MLPSNVDAIRDRVYAFPYWYHIFEVAPGVVTPGINQCEELLHSLQLPDDCHGLRALDIGARDGFFSFELERRGAEVLAIDHVPPTATGFHIAQPLLQSRVHYEIANLYELSPERFGTFDIVLFLGVLYHLRNPLLALDTIRSVCRGHLWLESHVLDNCFVTDSGSMVPLAQFGAEVGSANLMQFYPSGELSGDHSNWWAPTVACLSGMLQSSNFKVINHSVNGSRAIFKCTAVEEKAGNFYRAAESATVETEEAIRKYQSALAAWPRQR